MKSLLACLLVASTGCATLRGPGDRPLRIDWTFTEVPSAEGETRAAQRKIASHGLEIARSREEADLVADVEETGDGFFLRVWTPTEMILWRGHRHEESCDWGEKDGARIVELLEGSPRVRSYIGNLRDGGAAPWGSELALVLEPFTSRLDEAARASLTADRRQRVREAAREAVQAVPLYKVLSFPAQDELLARGGMSTATCAERLVAKSTWDEMARCRDDAAALAGARMIVWVELGVTADWIWVGGYAVRAGTPLMPSSASMSVHRMDEVPMAVRAVVSLALRTAR